MYTAKDIKKINEEYTDKFNDIRYTKEELDEKVNELTEKIYEYVTEHPKACRYKCYQLSPPVRKRLRKLGFHMTDYIIDDKTAKIGTIIFW